MIWLERNLKNLVMLMGLMYLALITLLSFYLVWQFISTGATNQKLALTSVGTLLSGVPIIWRVHSTIIEQYRLDSEYNSKPGEPPKNR